MTTLQGISQNRRHTMSGTTSFTSKRLLANPNEPEKSLITDPPRLPVRQELISVPEASNIK